MKPWQFFLIFMRIGVSTFGGGYAMLPILQHELIDKRGWLQEDELTEAYALAQCEPGLICVNTAVLLIRPRFGLLPAVVASLGVVLPSVLILILIAAVLYRYANLPLVQNAFAGIRVAVAAIVVHSAWRLLKNGVHDFASGLLYAAAFLLLLFDLLNPVLIIIMAAVVGLLIQTLRAVRKGKAVRK